MISMVYFWHSMFCERACTLFPFLSWFASLCFTLQKIERINEQHVRVILTRYSKANFYENTHTHTRTPASTVLKAMMMAMMKNWSVSTANALQMREKNTIEEQICTLHIWKWLPSNNYCLQHVTRQTMIIIYSLIRRVALWHERYSSGNTVYVRMYNIPLRLLYI